MPDSNDERTEKPGLKRNWMFMATAFALTIAAAIGTYAWQVGALGTEAEPEHMSAADAVLAAGFDKSDKAAVEAIVREYILAHPEIIPEAIDLLRTRQAAQRIDAVRDRIETPYAASFAGNPNGKVVLVEYSDFSCGFCRQSVADVERLIAENPDLKIVFHELPILSEESNLAAAWAMAAAKQGKYYAFHKAMFAAGRPHDRTVLIAAENAGLDIAAARAFIAGSVPKKVIEENIGIAQRLEFSGTPSWVVGNQILNGAVGYDALSEAVDAARAQSL